MSFVKEIIETDEQEELFNSFGFRDSIGKLRKVRKSLTRWYIDKEKEMYFVEMGGGSFGVPHMYGLMTRQGLIIIWQGQGRLEKEVDNEKHFRRYWNLEKIYYPKTMFYTKEEIKNFVIEAICDMDKQQVSNGETYTAVMDYVAEPGVYSKWEEDYYVQND